MSQPSMTLPRLSNALMSMSMRTQPSMTLSGLTNALVSQLMRTQPSMTSSLHCPALLYTTQQDILIALSYSPVQGLVVQHRHLMRVSTALSCPHNARPGMPLSCSYMQDLASQYLLISCTMLSSHIYTHCCYIPTQQVQH